MPFWRTKTLQEMTSEEWESLCDGCGRCCLVKLEDEDCGKIHVTRLACQLLNTETCRCGDYTNRHQEMADCVSIDAGNVGKLDWLPLSCAYRRMADGRGLAWWHPLVSGTRDTVEEAGISVKSFVQTEAGIKEASYYRYIIDERDLEDY